MVAAYVVTCTPQKLVVDIKEALVHANAFFQDGDFEEALRMYTRVRDSLDRSGSDWAICHNQMGLCYSKLGNDVKAIKAYTAAIETGIEHEEIHIWHMNRAMQLKASGNFERAKRGLTLPKGTT